MVLQVLVTVDTQTVVPPLTTDPTTVAPLANATGPTEAPNDERSGAMKAGTVAKAGRGTTGGVSARAAATGAAIASAAMTPVAKAACLLIGLRLVVDKRLLLVGPGRRSTRAVSTIRVSRTRPRVSSATVIGRTIFAQEDGANRRRFACSIGQFTLPNRPDPWRSHGARQSSFSRSAIACRRRGA